MLFNPDVRKRVLSVASALENNHYIEYDIQAFLEGEGKDHLGRTLEEIWNFDDDKLEKCHDWVQTAFPIDTESDHARCKTISIMDARKLRSSEKVKANIRITYKRWLDFLGIQPYDAEKQDVWLHYTTHNFKRISRVLRCLRLFGLDEEADEFYNTLIQIRKANPDCINDRTFGFWTERNQRV